MKRAKTQPAAWLAGLYFVAMAVGVTFPGVAPFNNVRPFVFGIPFVFAWYVGWILGALLVFYYLHRSTDR